MIKIKELINVSNDSVLFELILIFLACFIVFEIESVYQHLFKIITTAISTFHRIKGTFLHFLLLLTIKIILMKIFNTRDHYIFFAISTYDKVLFEHIPTNNFFRIIQTNIVIINEFHKKCIENLNLFNSARIVKPLGTHGTLGTDSEGS